LASHPPATPSVFLHFGVGAPVSRACHLDWFFENQIVAYHGAMCEAEWLAKKKPEQQLSWEADKAALDQRFFQGIRE